jgi:hypothetical protein
MALIALAVAIFALPSIYNGVNKEFPVINVTLLQLFIGGLYVSSIPFFISLYQGLVLLSNIDNNIAFSEKSVRALKHIKYCASFIILCYALGIPFLFQVAELDDAPGLGVIALAFTCIPLVIATFAAVLEKLIQSGLDLKQENDLTV